MTASRTGTSALLALTLLSGDEEARDELTRWTRRAGLDIDAPLRVVLVTSRSAEASSWPASGATGRSSTGSGATGRAAMARRATVSERLAGRLRERLAPSRAHPALVTTFADVVAAVRPAGDPAALLTDWSDISAALAEPDDTVRVAVGGSGVWPAGLRASLEQAQCLIDLQRRGSPLGTVPDVVVFETAGLISGLIGGSGGRDLVGFAHRVLEPLLDNDRCGGELLETLYAYLACAGSTGQAAKLLHLHPSSVKYRLKLIRQLIGRDRLDDPQARFELELAVRVIMSVLQLDACQPGNGRPG